MDKFNENLLDFLNLSPTPFHAIATMKDRLTQHGYKELHETDRWNLVENERYFVIRNNSSIVAFNYTSNFQEGMILVGAHTDSPTLQIKPKPTRFSYETLQWGIEPYGGILLHPWFDRDLGIAGRVFVSEYGKTTERLININKPIAYIPSLAIHLNKEANTNNSINAQTDIVPIIATEQKEFNEFILEELQCSSEAKVLSHELNLYDLTKASLLGIKNDFITSSRLDNLLSCFAGLTALIESDKAFVCSFMDHEEVGSDSHVGAGGSFLKDVLERVIRVESPRFYQKSVMISCDNAHAQHPNFPYKHENEHTPHLNQGIVIKINSNQRYATNAFTQSLIIEAAEKANIPIQYFVTRSDLGCGSTIGPITASKLGIKTIDVGIPQLGMHSIREICGSKDTYYLYKLLLTI